MARYPLNGTPRISNTHGAAGWGTFGRHLGIDFAVGVGAPVYAPVSGTVREVVETSGAGSGGKRIELAGVDGMWHRFLHLSSWNVSRNQYVVEGQIIGWSGATGDVTGPHLHWDVRKAGTAWNASFTNYVDPIKHVDSLNSKHKPVNIGRTLFLKPNNAAGKPITDWSVYDPNTPLPVKRANRFDFVNPAKYGGIRYLILGNPAKNTYEVYSPYFKKNILVYADSDAQIL